MVDIKHDLTTPAMQALIEASTAASEVQNGEVISTNGNSALVNLDPNEHARIGDPLVRPAKKHTLIKNIINIRNSCVAADPNGIQSPVADDETKNNLDYTQDNAISSNHQAKTQPTVEYSESILSRLFEPDRKQKPELWEFIRLVAPGPANQPPEGRYKWRSKDAVAAYCLKCKIAFTYTPGTSKTVSRHLIAYHGLNGGRRKNRSQTVVSSESKRTNENVGALISTTEAVASKKRKPSGHNDSILKASGDTRRGSQQSSINIGATLQTIDKGSVDQDDHSEDCNNQTYCEIKQSRSNKKRKKQVLNFNGTKHGSFYGDEASLLEGTVGNRKALIAKALFRWLVGSYQPLDCYENSNYARINSSSMFVDFCKTLDESFELPEPSVMDSLVADSHTKLQNEIKIHVSKLFPKNTNGKTNYEFISASVRRVRIASINTDIVDSQHIGQTKKDRVRKSCEEGEGIMNEPQIVPQGLEVQENVLYPVRLSFCTPLFRIKSYVIAVIPNESIKLSGRMQSEENKCDDDIFTPYFEAVNHALRIHGFPQENLSRVIIRGSSSEIEEGVSTSTQGSECLCILDRLDNIVARNLRHTINLPGVVQELLCQNEVFSRVKINNSVQNPTTSILCTVRAYDTLLASLASREEAEGARSNAITQVLNIITPFYDAIQTLSNDSYSTIGLAIPVLRRVQQILLEGGKSILPGTDAYSKNDDSPNGAQKLSMESFHTSILNDFQKTFSSVLNKNPDLMWTIPLDPRLIAMQGLSDTEKKLVKSTLIEEVEKAVQIIDEKGRNRNGTDIANDMEQSTSKWGGIRHSSSSTMGGIFWGEDSNLATSDNPSSNLFSSNTKNAKEYARLNVNSYFNTVHSQRHIKDPLLWWSNNQNQFPELAMLARKWICASAVYGRKNTRDFESTNVIQTTCTDVENIRRMIFLHDNNDLL